MEEVKKTIRLDKYTTWRDTLSDTSVYCVGICHEDNDSAEPDRRSDLSHCSHFEGQHKSASANCSDIVPAFPCASHAMLCLPDADHSTLKP